MRCIFIFYNRLYLALMFIVAVILLVGSITLLFSSGKVGEPVGGIILSLVMIVYFSLKLVDRRPIVVLSREGVFYRSMSWRGKIVRWEEIQQVEERTIGRGTRLIALHTAMRKYTIYTSGMNIPRRELAGLIHHLSTLPAENRQGFIDHVTGA